MEKRRPPVKKKGKPCFYRTLEILVWGGCQGIEKDEGGSYRFKSAKGSDVEGELPSFPLSIREPIPKKRQNRHDGAMFER